MIASHTISAVQNGETCLLTTESEGLLIDSGYDYGSDTLALEVKNILGNRPLTGVLITHSHYDHASGCAGIKRLFPETKIAASALTAELLRKDSVKQTIRELNEGVAKISGGSYSDQVDGLRIDLPLTDREIFALGSFIITALATPGHTRCCMSYYIPEAGLLACSESTGVMVDGRLLPGFVVSCPMSLESIEKCASLGPQRIIAPHHGELDPSSAEDFFPQAKAVTEQAAAFILARHRQGQDQETIVRAFVREYYGENSSMPMQSILLNTVATVARLIEQSGK